MGKNIATLRRELALLMESGKVVDALRELKKMTVADLEALSIAESKEIVDDSGMDETGKKQLAHGLEKLSFYVCGILMHRILDGE